MLGGVAGLEEAAGGMEGAELDGDLEIVVY